MRGKRNKWLVVSLAMLLVLSAIITSSGNVIGEDTSIKGKSTNINSPNEDSLTGEVILDLSKIKIEESNNPTSYSEKLPNEILNKIDSPSIIPPSTPFNDNLIDNSDSKKVYPIIEAESQQYPGQICNFDEDTSPYISILDATPTGEKYMLFDDWDGTWCDVEKVLPDDADGIPPGTGDDYLCWAAAASNVLEWTGWGQVGGMTTTDDMFQHFQDHWTDEGGYTEYGWEWWFDGTDDAPSGSTVDVPGGGGFYLPLNFLDYYHSSFTDSLALAKIDEYLVVS